MRVVDARGDNEGAFSKEYTVDSAVMLIVEEVRGGVEALMGTYCLSAVFLICSRKARPFTEVDSGVSPLLRSPSCDA